MTPFVRGLIRAAAESFTLPGPILEIGSRTADGQDDFGSPRAWFPGRSYTGLDLQDGPGVDVVASAEALPQDDASVGTVLILETLEHIERFWLAVDEIQRVLRPDGALIVTVPFYVHIHKHPEDYWRFTPAALDRLLATYPQRLVGYQGAPRRPTGSWAVCFGPERPAPTAAAVAAFRQRLTAYCRWPVRPLRWLQALLGRLLFGRRPFEPYLQRNRFDFTWHQDEVADASRPLPAGSRQAA